MLCASHTHSGPATVKLRDCGEVSPDYIAFLESQVIQLIVRAYSTCIVSEDNILVEYSQYVAEDFAINRRDSAVGPIDSAVRILRFSSSSRETVSYIVNYACHGVCLDGCTISGDYISHVCNELEESTRCVALYLNGPSGDINPRHRSKESAVGIGRSIAHSILELPTDAWQPTISDKLICMSKSILFPFEDSPTHETLAQEISSRTRELSSSNEITRKIARAMIGWANDVSYRLDKGTAQTVETAVITVVKIGNIIVASLPGEIFTSIGIDIRNRLIGRPVILAAHSNGSIGYLPGEEDYDKGGYELDAYKWYDYPSRLSSECSRLLVDTISSIAKKLD